MTSFTLPLLNDHHTHLGLYAGFQNALHLGEEDTKKTTTQKIVHRKDRICIVFGWNDSRIVFTAKEFNLLPPTLLINISLHGFRINQGARKILLIETSHPFHRQIIEKLEHPEWAEDHLPEIFNYISLLTPINEKMLDQFFQSLLSLGIWSLHDLFISDPKLIRMVMNGQYKDRVTFWTGPDVFKSLTSELQAHIKGIKLFTDGALGAKTATISRPYLSGGSPNLLHSDKAFEKLLDRSFSLKNNAAIHAIGDKACTQVVTVLEHHFPKGLGKHDIRLEHCQFITRDTALRAKKLGIILSMQPNFNSDSIHYQDRLPRELLTLNNPFRMLIDEAGFEPGKDLIFGSDGMPHGIQYALEQALFPFDMNQFLSIDEIVKGYCVEGYDHGEIDVDVDFKERKVRTRVAVE